MSVLTGVMGLFQPGPSSKQEACFASQGAWGQMDRYFSECQQNPKWEVESCHQWALCTCVNEAYNVIMCSGRGLGTCSWTDEQERAEDRWVENPYIT